MECFNNFDSLVIAYLLFGLAAGMIVGAVLVDRIHKSYKGLD